MEQKITEADKEEITKIVEAWLIEFGNRPVTINEFHNWGTYQRMDGRVEHYRPDYFSHDTSAKSFLNETYSITNEALELYKNYTPEQQTGGSVEEKEK